MERRIAVHARAYRQALIAVAWLSGVAVAAPKSPPAKAAFDVGVAAYQKEDWSAATAAFGKSYALEADIETLFAWAQAERKLGHCDKALDLYEKLLAAGLPEENAAVVREKRDECRALAPKPKPTPPPPPPEPPPEAHPPPPPPRPEGRAWYRDPVGDGLVVGGGVSLGIGVGMLVAGHSADHAKTMATTYGEFTADRDKAKRDGTIGIVLGSIGAGAIGAGIAWYVLHRHPAETTLTAWGDSTSGGFSVAGWF